MHLFDSCPGQPRRDGMTRPEIQGFGTPNALACEARDFLEVVAAFPIESNPRYSQPVVLDDLGACFLLPKLPTISLPGRSAYVVA